MDFRNLQYFVTVAEELSFSRAAEKLNMSQPPLSYQIKQLEEELNTVLFIRGSRRLTLTESGNLLLQRSRQILSLGDKTKSDISQLDNALTGTVHLGIVDGCAPFYVAKWIREFHELHPMVRFELRNGSSDEMIDHISRGLADLAIVALPYDMSRLTGQLVAYEPWVAYMSADHPLAKLPGDSIPLRDLVGEPLIVPRRSQRREAIRRWFRSIGEEPTVLCALANYVDVLALAEAGAGIAIYPQTHVLMSGSIVTKVITDPIKYAEYALVYEKDQRITGASLEFLDFIRNKLDEGTGDMQLTPEELLSMELL